MGIEFSGVKTPTLDQIQTGAEQVIDEGKQKIKAQISTNNSFGAGKADSQTDLAEAMGLAKAVVKSAVDLASMMMSLRSKTEHAQLATSSENIKAIKEKKATFAEKRLDDLNKMLKEFDKAEKSGKLGKIFGWIAAAATILAGALLMVAGGAGAALIVAGAAMMACMALQETGAMEVIMEGLQDFGMMMGMNEEQAAIFATCVVATAIIAMSIAAGCVAGPAAGIAFAATMLNLLATPENLQAMGVPEEKAAAISMGISIGLAVVAIGAGLGSAAGSSAKVADLANKGSKIAGLMKGFANAGKAMKISASMAQKVPQTAQAIARTGSYVSQGIAAASTIGGGAAAIDSAVHMSKAQDAEADTKELEAFLAMMQNKFDEESERIEEILSRLDELASAVLSIFKGDGALFDKIMEI